MGEIKTFDTRTLIPTQTKLFYESMRTIVADYAGKREHMILPPAIRVIDGLPFIIDGHNTAMIAHFMSGEVKSFIVDSPSDFIKESDYYRIPANVIIDRNTIIATHFHDPEEFGLETARNGVLYLPGLLENLENRRSLMRAISMSNEI